jgi:hypothetical protein
MFEECLMWKPGQSGNPSGETKTKRGVKKGTIRGPYKTNKLFRNREYLMRNKPDLQIVDNAMEAIKPGAYLRSIVSTESMPHRDRMTAALGLMRYEEPPAEGRYLTAKWDEPAPKTLEQAIEQSGKIAELHRRGVYTDAEAAALHDGINRIAQLMGWADLAKRVEALEAKDAARQEAGVASGVQVAIVSDLPLLPGNERLLMPGRVNTEGEYVVSGVGQSGQEPGEAPESKNPADTADGRGDQG